MEWYFDYSCPFAFVSSRVIESLVSRCGIKLILRPVLLGAIFSASQVTDASGKSNISYSSILTKPKAEYLKVELLRLLALHKLTVGVPYKHPQRTVDALRCTFAAPEDIRLDIVHAFFRAYWEQGVALELNPRETHIAILETTGMSAKAAGIIWERAQSADGKAALENATQEALENDVFGVPLFVCKEQKFYGAGLIPYMERKIRGAGSVSPILDCPLYKSGDASMVVNPPVQFFFDYSSPFTYVTAMRIEKMFGASQIVYRPMLLGAVFKAIGGVNMPVEAMSERRRKYFHFDLSRQVEDAGVQFTFASRFPIRSLFPLRLTVAAIRRNLASSLLSSMIRSIFTYCWAEDGDPESVDHMLAILNKSGISDSESKALVAATREDAVKKLLIQNSEDAVRRGIFGAPSIVVCAGTPYEGVFFGNDTLELAVYAARKASSGDFSILGVSHAPNSSKL